MHTTRHAIHPDHFKTLDTTDIRRNFLIDNLFTTDNISITYTHYDRLIIGGVAPLSKSIQLPSIDSLKASYFLERREIGIINVGKKGTIRVDGTSYTLENKEALYVGRGAREISFESGDGVLFYFNSAPAHTSYPTKKISLQDAETVEIGATETSNHRIIRKLIVNSVLQTCQLQMGLTELQRGSVWNTMPPHTHDRRMEAYFYFNIPDDHAVCHFLGEPQETRHIWVKNNEAVLSPPWSIHSGSGTSNYAFIWGMAGENLDYGDMDVVKPSDIR